MSQALFQRQISLFCCHPLCFSKNNPKSRIQEQFLGQDHQNGDKHSVTYQLRSSRLTSKIHLFIFLQSSSALPLSQVFIIISLAERNYPFPLPRQSFLECLFPSSPEKRKGRKLWKFRVMELLPNQPPNQFLRFYLCFWVYRENVRKLQIYFIVFRNLGFTWYWLKWENFFVFHFTPILYFLYCIFQTNDTNNSIFTSWYLLVRFWLGGNHRIN